MSSTNADVNIADFQAFIQWRKNIGLDHTIFTINGIKLAATETLLAALPNATALATRDMLTGIHPSDSWYVFAQDTILEELKARHVQIP